jgi:NAD(P)-dependent dehydrogenase (short-subunit alcohol dehydrogenase family)
MMRTIVLTGATRGLGRVLAKGLMTRGHTVLGCGRDPEAIQALCDEHGPPHDFSALDVGDDEAVRAWSERLLSQHGAPQLLINNAALINHPAPLWQVPAGEFDALLRVNLGGVANAIRHFVPAMIAAGEGVILNFSSGWGRVTSPEVGPYCATKWGIEGLSRALASELPAGLAAAPLNPGIINTEMLQKVWGADARAFPDAERWAEVAVDYILSIGPEHSGQALTVPS